MSCYSDFSEVSIKPSISSFQSFGKRAVFVLSNSKSEGWEKFRKVSLESEIMKTRNQDPVQFSGR